MSFVIKLTSELAGVVYYFVDGKKASSCLADATTFETRNDADKKRKKLARRWVEAATVEEIVP